MAQKFKSFKSLREAHIKAFGREEADEVIRAAALKRSRIEAIQRELGCDGSMARAVLKVRDRLRR